MLVQSSEKSDGVVTRDRFIIRTASYQSLLVNSTNSRRYHSCYGSLLLLEVVDARRRIHIPPLERASKKNRLPCQRYYCRSH